MIEGPVLLLETTTVEGTGDASTVPIPDGTEAGMGSVSLDSDGSTAVSDDANATLSSSVGEITSASSGSSGSTGTVTAGPDGSQTAADAEDGASGETSSVADASTGSEACIASQGGEGTTLIDDLEDGDASIPEEDGRSGWWYTADDMTPAGERIPSDPWAPSDADAFTGEFAAHIAGRGYVDWGATLGLTLNEECPYDGSMFSGIEFWARGAGSIRVRFTTMATVPSDLEPGTCDGVCWDEFGTVIDVTDSWERYTVEWGDLSQEGWGEPAEFDPVTLLAIVWQGGRDMAAFDLWIDDIRFLDGDP